MRNFLIMLVLLFGSCEYNNDSDAYQANIFPIDLTELIYKKGDCITFNVDSGKHIVGIVTDYSKDEDGLWYGICFTNYFDTIVPNITIMLTAKLYGRKVHSWSTKGYFIGLDDVYVSDSCLRVWNKEIKLMGNIKLNTDKIKIASEEGTNNYNQLIEYFKYNRQRRLTPPDDYRAHLWKMERFRPDEYFPVRYFASK